MQPYIATIMGLPDREKEDIQSRTLNMRNINKWPIGSTFKVRVIGDTGTHLKVNCSEWSPEIVEPLFKGDMTRDAYFYMRREHYVFKNIDFNPAILKEIEIEEPATNNPYMISFKIVEHFRKGDHRILIDTIRVYDYNTGRYITVKNDHA